MTEVDPVIIFALCAAVVTLTAVTYCGKSIFFKEKKTIGSGSKHSSARNQKTETLATKSKKKVKSSVKEKKAATVKTFEETATEVKPENTASTTDLPKQLASETQTNKKSKKSSTIKVASAGLKGSDNGVFHAKSESTDNNSDDLEILQLASTQAVVHHTDDWVEIKKSKSKKSATPSPVPQISTVTQSSSIVPEEIVISVPEPVVATQQPVAVEEVAKKTIDEVIVPAKKVGALIGVKGAVKIALQNVTGTDLQFPKANKDSLEPVTVTITGSAEGVKEAKKAIQDLIKKGYTAILQGEDFRETQVPVHNTYLADIIGKSGANIRAIQDSLQVKITIPPPISSTASVTENGTLKEKTTVKIGISGLKDNVIKAKALIKELVQYYHTPITHPGLIHEELDIPTQYYQYIIGSKGSEIKHIQANFKVSVHIPNVNSVNRNVVVVGLPSHVENAKKYILKIVDNISNGRPKNGELKNKTTEEMEPVDSIDDIVEESRPHEVYIEDLFQAAKHISSSHLTQSHLVGAVTGTITGAVSSNEMNVMNGGATPDSDWNSSVLGGGGTSSSAW